MNRHKSQTSQHGHRDNYPLAGMQARETIIMPENKNYNPKNQYIGKRGKRRSVPDFLLGKIYFAHFSLLFNASKSEERFGDDDSVAFLEVDIPRAVAGFQDMLYRNFYGFCLISFFPDYLYAVLVGYIGEASSYGNSIDYCSRAADLITYRPLDFSQDIKLSVNFYNDIYLGVNKIILA